MALSLRICDYDKVADRWLIGTDEELVEVGGRWDKKLKRWLGEAKKLRIVRIPRGSDQELPARWMAEWLRRYHVNRRPGPHWNVPVKITGGPQRISMEFRRAWTVMLAGGRRGGKSFMALVAAALMMLMVPGTLVWAVSPKQEKSDELEAVWKWLIPRHWYGKPRKQGAGKSLEYRFPNGSRILFISGYNDENLKAGRVDFAIYNEAQMMTQQGLINLRGGVVDRGGIVAVCCNPPSKARGLWIEELYAKARAMKIAAVAFHLRGKHNPLVTEEALEDLRGEMDAITARKDVDGEMGVPTGDIVFHAWSDAESIIEAIDPTWVDVTREETKRELGRGADYIIGEDYQATPHMVAIVQKLFRDRAGDLINVIVDEIVVEKANENDLCDALEGDRPEILSGRWTAKGREDGVGYDPDGCAVVPDATGITTQDGAHSRPGRTSRDWLVARGWRWLYFPDRAANRNPDISERCKVTNARLKNSDGKRRMFALAHCLQVHRAMRSWENRGGVPFRKSAHAHICDAVSYPIFRFFARTRTRTKSELYTPEGKFTARDEMSGW